MRPRDWTRLGLLLLSIDALLRCVGLLVPLVRSIDAGQLNWSSTGHNALAVILFGAASFFLWHWSGRIAERLHDATTGFNRATVHVVVTSTFAFIGVWIAATTVRDLALSGYQFLFPPKPFGYTSDIASYQSTQRHQAIIPLLGLAIRLLIAAWLFYKARLIAGKFVEKSEGSPVDEEPSEPEFN